MYATTIFRVFFKYGKTGLFQPGGMADQYLILCLGIISSINLFCKIELYLYLSMPVLYSFGSCYLDRLFDDKTILNQGNS
jgi:hypothetical protein